VPARQTPTGAPCWLDLFSSDTDRAEEFYGRLFGWTAEHSGPEFGNYINFDLAGARVAGMMHNAGDQGMPDTWNLYFSTPDAKATAEAVSAAGGVVHMEPTQVADLGTMAMVGAPDGAVLGLWEPGTFAGYGVHNQAGAPMWHELHTRDYAGALDFYRSVLGWTTQVVGDTDDFRYSAMAVGDTQYAGVMDASAYYPEGVPPVWLTYIAVDDVDATLTLVQELGGTIQEQPQDTPFGRLAQIADPTGAVIKISSLTPPTT
jgi:predicted enzyme related to lactoylglutathione lyase